MADAPALVLFDIDGTLLRRAGSHHKDALVCAVREVTGHQTCFDQIPTGGMLDRDLIRTLLLSAGAAARDIDDWLPRIVERAQSEYLLACPALEDKLCPGVRDLLERLREARVPAGLVTGNLTVIGWKKIEAAGLRPFFALGAFADMAATRAELVRIAIRASLDKKLLAPGGVVSLIGDHPNDVQAAKLNGVRSIAVATGLSTRDELAACDPDVLVSDLRSLDLESLL